MVFLDLLGIGVEQVGLGLLRWSELVDVFCGAFHGLGSQVFLVGLLEGDGGRLSRHIHIPTLAILLDYAP